MGVEFSLEVSLGQCSVGALQERQREELGISRPHCGERCKGVEYGNTEERKRRAGESQRPGPCAGECTLERSCCGR